MADPASHFYDEFAASYHLMFEDWEASIARQASAIRSILQRDGGPGPGAAILDCACGIGTQSLGLAQLGFRVTGSDISAGAVQRARLEAAARGLSIPFHVADMRNLDHLPAAGFDAVVCMDNALPHLGSEADLADAAAQIRARLRTGGRFLASVRDYDEILRERPVVQCPVFYSDGGKRRIAFQVWDWQDERRYTFHMYITRETPAGWSDFHGVSAYRAVLRDEITGILAVRGFTYIRWQFPAGSGFYQPIVIATADALAAPLLTLAEVESPINPEVVCAARCVPAKYGADPSRIPGSGACGGRRYGPNIDRGWGLTEPHRHLRFIRSGSFQSGYGSWDLRAPARWHAPDQGRPEFHH